MNLTKLLPYFYLCLSATGFFAFIFAFKGVEANDGFNLIQFISSTWTTDFYAKSITIDFWVAAMTGLIFMVIEGIRLNIRFFWVYIILSIIIAFACFFPLFLFVREKYLAKSN